MRTFRRLGWSLIALAGFLSLGIVSLEIISLVNIGNSDSQDVLPVLEFQPAGED